MELEFAVGEEVRRLVADSQVEQWSDTPFNMSKLSGDWFLGRYSRFHQSRLVNSRCLGR